MKRTSLIAAFALALVAAPTFADESPAEKFGAAHGGASGSPAAYDMAVSKLSGTDLDDKIVPIQTGVATRGVSIGTQALATNLGVSPDDYTRIELARMFIGRYD